MSSEKALNPLEEQRSKAMIRWLAAQEEHSKAHTWFYRLRTQLPPKDQMNSAQRDLYNVARAKLSEATKKRAQEEQLFNMSMNPLLARPSEILTDSMQNALAQAVLNIFTIPDSAMVDLKAAREQKVAASEYKQRAEASPEEAALQEIIKKTAIAHKEGRNIDPVFLDDGQPIPSIPKRPPNHVDESPVLELVSDIDGEPIDDSLMDTDPDPVSVQVTIAPEAPEPLKTQELEQPETEQPEPSRRERVLSNPLWASIAQAASEFVPPSKASPLEQEGNGMPKTYDEYVKERELAQANTPQFEQNVETEPNPNPKG